MSDRLDQLYRDVIMEHYKFPRGSKDIEDADMDNQGQNPACGDEIEVKVKLEGDRVKDVSVSCMGCAISVASGSMLAEVIEGKTLAEVKKIAKVVKALLKGEDIPEDIDIHELVCANSRYGSNAHFYRGRLWLTPSILSKPARRPS